MFLPLWILIPLFVCAGIVYLIVGACAVFDVEERLGLSLYDDMAWSFLLLWPLYWPIYRVVMWFQGIDERFD